MHKNTYAVLAGTVLVWSTLLCQLRAAEVLKVTPKSGTIQFTGFKDDASHAGGFEEFTGTVKLVPDDLESSEIHLEIKTGSLWSDHPGLTAHLLNEDFFDVEKFPKAVFQSKTLRKARPDERIGAGRRNVSHVLTGQLKLLAATEKLDIPMEIKLTDDALTVKGTYHLDRTQFGMNYGLEKIHRGVLVEFSLKLPRKEPTGEG
jgi:polyisoprenoid-binding protein YceI